MSHVRYFNRYYNTQLAEDDENSPDLAVSRAPGEKDYGWTSSNWRLKTYPEKTVSYFGNFWNALFKVFRSNIYK